MSTLKAAAVAAAIFACSSGAAAQTKLTREEAAAAFGSREKILDASISPKGDQVALVIPGQGQSTIVATLDVASATSKVVNSADGNPMAISGCNWASDQRVVCSLYGVTDRNYNQMLAYSRLIALDPDGANPRALGAFEKSQEYVAQSDGYVVDWRDGKSDAILLARNYVPGRSMGVSIATSMAEGLGVDLVDTRTGKATHVESPDPTVMRYLADGLGNIRMRASDESLRLTSQSLGIRTFRYRLVGSREWQPFSTYNDVTNEGLYPIAIDGAANIAYALEKLNGRDALYRVSLDGSMKKELVLANPKVDIDGIVRMGRLGRVVGASYSDEYPRVEYFDAKYAALTKGLSRALPNLPMIRIVDSNADETIHIVHASSDTNPGRYYVFNATKKTLTEIGEDRPQLSGVALGEMKPITYTAADGTQIPAYLTLPPGTTGKGLPAIVMPHGGPASRDEWGFDWLVQFFVSRGYAVLQPNYRGSSGFGEGWFQNNGFRSWKTAIGDVNDAGRWLVAQGIGDPAKLAIVGWSYGGYAALQANVVDSGLYKAAVAIAPVTDLGMLRGETRGFTNTKLARDYIGEGPQLKEGSPLQHPEAFRVPVLMFHGSKDINVGIAQSRAMERALVKAGKKATLVTYPNIDHQLKDSAVRTDMLLKADAFLSQALGL